jgi:hypothetical protein
VRPTSRWFRLAKARRFCSRHSGSVRCHEMNRSLPTPRRRNPEHWVCFGCRKMFRKSSRWLSDGADSTPRHLCPQCRQPMRDMGKYFEPPRALDRRSWEIMRRVADAGLFFHSEGSKAFINAFIIGKLRPSPSAVFARLAEHQRRTPNKPLHATALRNAARER